MTRGRCAQEPPGRRWRHLHPDRCLLYSNYCTFFCTPGPVAGCTTAQAHYEIVMVEEEQPAQPALPVSEFQMLQEKQGYNLQLLEQHRLSEG